MLPALRYPIHIFWGSTEYKTGAHQRRQSQALPRQIFQSVGEGVGGG